MKTNIAIILALITGFLIVVKGSIIYGVITIILSLVFLIIFAPNNLSYYFSYVTERLSDVISKLLNKK